LNCPFKGSSITGISFAIDAIRYSVHPNHTFGPDTSGSGKLLALISNWGRRRWTFSLFLRKI
jgi:hypothetical protein